jgi:endonuclease G
MNTLRSLSIVFGLLLTTSVYAMDFGRCNDLFPNKRGPEVPSSLINTKGPVRALCFSEYAVLYSTDTKTPVYSIERLSYLRINRKVKRRNHFHEEPQLRLSERSSPKDYKKSGFDMGHNANARDMGTEFSSEESFSMSNMSPEYPNLNRKTWNHNVEEATRKYVKRSAGDIYVFTGNYYEPGYQTIGRNRVGIPTAIWKLVWDSQTKKSWCFFIQNTNSPRMTAPITYQEFVAKTGLHLLD